MIPLHFPAIASVDEMAGANVEVDTIVNVDDVELIPWAVILNAISSWKSGRGTVIVLPVGAMDA